MKFLHNTARITTLPSIGRVEFDVPDRLYLGRVAWHVDFRFEVDEREYWGTVFLNSGEVELRTHGRDGFGRAVRHDHKGSWRVELLREGLEIIREARRIWREAFAVVETEQCPLTEADRTVDRHYRALREEGTGRQPIIDNKTGEQVSVTGPVCIVDGAGVHVEALERIAEGQRSFYQPSVDAMRSKPVRPIIGENEVVERTLRYQVERESHGRHDTGQVKWLAFYDPQDTLEGAQEVLRSALAVHDAVPFLTGHYRIVKRLVRITQKQIGDVVTVPSKEA